MFSGVLGIGFISYEGREWVQGEGENVWVVQGEKVNSNMCGVKLG